MQPSLSEWVPPSLEQAIQEKAAHYRALTSAQLEAEIKALLIHRKRSTRPGQTGSGGSEKKI